MVKELLLGDNPFIGVSHMSQNKAREESQKVTLEHKIKVIEIALESGATGFTFSTHEDNLELLTYLERFRRDLLEEMNYYVLLPYAQFYVRKGNIAGTPALAKSVLKSVMRSLSRVSRVISGTFTLNPKKFAELFVEAELLPYLHILPKGKVKVVLMHEILTELLIAYDLAELLEYLDKSIRKRLKIAFGLETRNVSQLYNWLNKIDYYPEYIMTPLNPLGYQMTFSKEMAEEAIFALSSKSKILAISILASGAISINEAIHYLSGWKDRIYAVALGTLKPQRAKENFSKLKALLTES